jgi:hypothetical protein
MIGIGNSNLKKKVLTLAKCGIEPTWNLNI